VLRGERQVMLRRDAPRPVPAAADGAARGGRGARARGAAGTAGAGGSAGSARRATQVELTPEAEQLFERLRAWRTGVAKELGMPPYVIFHDATLRQIAAAQPATLASLASVNGVGETKLARYGQPILDLLADGGQTEPQLPSG
jgi:ATP-dependent DNA helicase RecQ